MEVKTEIKSNQFLLISLFTTSKEVRCHIGRTTSGSTPVANSQRRIEQEQLNGQLVTRSETLHSSISSRSQESAGAGVTPDEQGLELNINSLGEKNNSSRKRGWVAEKEKDGTTQTQELHLFCVHCDAPVKVSNSFSFCFNLTNPTKDIPFHFL